MVFNIFHSHEKKTYFFVDARKNTIISSYALDKIEIFVYNKICDNMP